MKMTWRDLIYDGISLSRERTDPNRTLPKTRGECPPYRPCPHVQCRHHAAIDVNEHNGEVRIRDTSLEDYSCILDVIDDYGGCVPPEVCARVLGMSYEDMKNAEHRAKKNMAQNMNTRLARELSED